MDWMTNGLTEGRLNERLSGILFQKLFNFTVLRYLQRSLQLVDVNLFVNVTVVKNIASANALHVFRLVLNILRRLRLFNNVFDQCMEYMFLIFHLCSVVC